MSYPNISDPEFSEKITNKLIRYKIPKKKRTFNQICFSKEFELQLPQISLAQYINPKTPYKGLLVFHKIGSGKTCTAINIAEQWKHVSNIIVVVPASLIGNFRGELRSKCAKNAYITDNEREKLKNLHPVSKEYNEIIAKSDARINKYYSIYSYHKFVEDVENDEVNFKNSILIIDEIQNMVSEGGKFYKTLYNAIHTAPKEMRIILLSATPMFDKPIEIALTLNLLRLPFDLPIGKEFEKMFIKLLQNRTTGEYKYTTKNMDIFKERIKGYISFYQGSPDYVFPKATIKYVRCEMSDFQYQSYVSVLKKEEKELNLSRKEIVRSFTVGEILDLPNNFFIGTRLISNVAFPNKNVGKKGFDSFRGKHLQLENLEEYSVKFHKIITRINKSSGPVFVYSNFKEYGGLKSFAEALEYNGYSDYTMTGEGRRRYAIMSGDASKQLKDEIKNVYNQIANVNGSQLKVLLLSPTAKEGISLLAVRQIHILEPYWNASRIMQVIGRGIRTCSHKNLPEEKRSVQVYIYISVHQNERETIDEYIAKMAQKKSHLINEFENALKEIAIDCELNKNANETEFEKLQCDK